ncbi:hypothetical protein E1B28_005240 [Marasmius oreades]|uniref:RNA-directed RNA polymerase n=1 Tax=Marasmius oreades TaxID=181124 RepID=A0A9P7V078_9AGAR|nr:uncharacterized protein E1B28_005240 [Marasmius oreades]KAG7097929.1 hypothetical protein E1B28_005240 [Marasmius oreades]
MPREHVLRQQLTREDESWYFNVARDVLQTPPPKTNPRTNEKTLFGKCIRFTVEKMVLQIQAFPYNRILHTDDPSKFIMCSFGDLRFPDTPLRTTAEYIMKVFKQGVWLNGVQYRFYGHSNSQLRSRSCFLREANEDEELDERIYQLGDFGKIMNVAKRAKRIGLLFSEAQIDFQLDPRYVADIPDIKSGDELFSDGCGLMSKRLAVQVSKQKKIIFRSVRYTPCVFQIRYLGYKGVLMLHPALDAAKPLHLAEFRKSMKKFTTTKNTTFSVVDYSKPYVCGRLNNDIIVLLSSLGITNENLIKKQQEYHTWITEAPTDPIKAFTFLSSMEEYQLAEKVLLDGLDDPTVQRGIKSRQDREVASFKGEKNNKNRSRMIIQKSRLLFGVCDPFGVLKEGEVHIRITTARAGPSTPIHGDVLVVRNPCLHPGDCLKLRAAHYKELSHLTDCIVFASVAKPGRHAAPSMSSGGDLDGDKYFVCWDPDLVPSVVAESYDYPPNKERASKAVSRMDMANHFASYNNAGLARVATLHARWVASSPKGALCSECQELNALHSQAVDGASVKIPEKLASPPPRPKDSEPFILDALAEHAKAFAEHFTESRAALASSSFTNNNDMTQDDRERLLLNLLQSEKLTNISEYQLFTLAWRFTRKYPEISLKNYLSHFDFGAFTTEQKHTIVGLLGLDLSRYPFVWNSLVRSDILGYRDLYQRDLNRPFSLQKLYSSKVDGMATFFEYLRMATQEYTRKVLILKTDDRFSIAIFMRGDIPWDEDPVVGNNVVVCSFLPQTSDNFATLRPCTVDYRLRCGDGVFQLYDKVMNNSFVFLVKPPRQSGAEVAASIALQKFSTRLQKQLGRLHRQPVIGIEIHVVSNRDRISHQLFDLWFEHVPTERQVRRFEREITSYTINDLSQVNWEDYPPWTKDLFVPKQTQQRFVARITDKTPDDLDRCMDLSLAYHAEDELYWIFTHMVSRPEPLQREWIMNWMDAYPPLAFVLLKIHPPDEETKSLPPITRPFRQKILQNIIRSANHLTIASLVALEKLAGSIAEIPVKDYFDLLWLVALSVRAPELVQEVLLVLNDCRATGAGADTNTPSTIPTHPPALRYGHLHALGIATDRAEEAADECPCDESGKPRKQRSPPVQAKLERDLDHSLWVKAAIRVDSRTSVRLHSHVRLQAASKPENRWVPAIVLDGVVVMAQRGEMKIELIHPPPPEIDALPSVEGEEGVGAGEEISPPSRLVDWNMYDAGSTATSRAMLDALTRLMKDKTECCGFYDIITGSQNSEAEATPTSFPPILEDDEHIAGLNDSQETAIRSCRGPLSLIWGPPGTGKTTVIVQILRGLVKTKDETARILMTASTHNAVDNVLERFVEMNKRFEILGEEQILRVATDISKVNKDLQSFTIDARVGGDMNENNKLYKKAKERLDAAVVVFTTCAGAGLGILRKADFEIALIDEASQINEPTALIPLVKGVRRAILVGDHVQLRPTVKPLGKILQFDVSLLERLYTIDEEVPGLNKAMLDIQYRFPQELALFPSNEFYQGRLRSGIQDSESVLGILRRSKFPWPVNEQGIVVPTVFLECASEEDMGGRSKSNVGQVDVIEKVIKLLTTEKEIEAGGQEETTPALGDLKITVLSPYTKQVKELHQRLPASISTSTIDSFQGRESDIIIFSSVRCNAEGDIGFVDDGRRLNVMWTRAKKGLILVGHRTTMEHNQMWKRAIGSCREVNLPEEAVA